MTRQGRFDSIEDVLTYNSKFHGRGNWFKFDGDFTYQNLSITNDDFEKPTQEFLEAELKKQQDEFDAQAYARLRAESYDPIPEQLDQIYHDIDGWKAKIKAVKDKYPKP
tara:strand:- start:40 stop:366 length:327 start_codon:yes stop_codon:yes gene_type:complete